MRVLLIVVLFCGSAFSKEADSKSFLDLKRTINYFVRGSYLQFQEKNNLYYAAAGVPLTWYAFEEDQRMSDLQRSKPLRKPYDIVGDLGIVFNFPLVPLAFYAYGRNNNNTHVQQFAMEYMAAMYLTLLETGIISYIPGHERPNKEGQSKWETSFRGKNSFPSGHIVPYATLFFKTLQFYGPYWSLPPLILTYWSSLQRAREGRHFVSDLIGSFFLSAFASEGVRRAAGYKDNHPFYQWLFEHEVEIGLSYHNGAYGPRLIYRF